MGQSYDGTVEIRDLAVANVAISDIESSNWRGGVRDLKASRSWTPGPVTVLLRDGPQTGYIAPAVIDVEFGEIVLQGTAPFATDHPTTPPSQ